MNIRVRKNLLQYFKTKASAQTYNILKSFFSFIGPDPAPLEVSSEYGQDGQGDYVRVALSCLTRDQALKLFALTKHPRQVVESFMFDDHQDACFGMGIADYGTESAQQRIKLYNYYDLSRKRALWKEHLLELGEKAGVSRLELKRDIGQFKKVRMSSVDIYDNGKIDLKVYYGPFFSKDFPSKFQSLFDTRTIRKYKDLLGPGLLSRLVLFCVRYNSDGKSIRTDFWCSARRIVPLLKRLDAHGDATRLYKDISALTTSRNLSFICIDMDKRPRTQFYFFLEKV